MRDGEAIGGAGWTKVALLTISLLVTSMPAWVGAQAPAESCVTCHTDVAKLKALTPPDPPAAEAGEG